MIAADPDPAAIISKSVFRFFRSDLDHAAIDEEFYSRYVTGIF